MSFAVISVGEVFTFEAVTEDVLQDGDKVKELWRRVVQRFGVGAIQQSLHGKPAHTESRDHMVRWSGNLKISPKQHFNIQKIIFIYINQFASF